MSDSTQAPAMDRLHGDLMTEYYRIVQIVEGFDQRLLTIKSWGVTFALATLGFGFQQGHYGLFLVAALGALAFWAIEGSVKMHQIRYYPRMAAIEVIAYNLFGQPTERGTVSSPLIDWSFYSYGNGRRGRRGGNDPQVPVSWEEQGTARYRWIAFYPHVALPHGIVVVLGLILFGVGLNGGFGPM